ncbi:unnamed protein product [Orchesella dallaii]|uniref:Uncharacterized protein n=1 Tax=Orchesella dallaii TaxID=48710 RepID=A0ABP1RCX1_9HEXA
MKVNPKSSMLPTNILNQKQPDYWKYWVLRLVRTGEKLSIMPFGYDNKRRLICGFTSSRHKLKWYITIACVVLDVIYLATVSSQVTASNATVTEVTDFYNHFISRLMGTLGVLAVFSKLEETAHFMNVLFVMREKMRVRLNMTTDVWTEEDLASQQQVINQLANSVFSDKMVPLILLAGIAVFVSGFAKAVRQLKSLSIVVILNSVLGTSLLFCAYQFLIESGGRIEHSSANIRAIGSAKFKCAVDRLRIKGCREIRMYMSSTMYFKPTSFASFAQTVLDRLIDFLLVT